MACLALTTEELKQNYVPQGEFYQQQFDELDISGYWISVGHEEVVKILRYYDDGSSTVIRSGSLELLERNGKSMGLIIGAYGFIPCNAKVVNV